MSESEEWKGYWKTAVSKIDDENCDVIIRGYRLSEIIGKLTYAQTLFLVVRGRLPSEAESAVLEAVLCSIPDYGLGPAPLATRTVAAANPQIIPAVIGGLLVAGSRFYSPQDCAEMLLKGCEERTKDGVTLDEIASRIVKRFAEQHKRLPGFGHPAYKYKDMRAVGIRKVAEKYGTVGENTRLLEAVHKELTKNPKLSHVPINVDGMIAATMLDLGFDVLPIAIVACISFMPGLIAHAIEEIQKGPGIRLIPEFMQSYVGEEDKHIG